ncbi:uncharacterized protein DSM5745_04126 [Aspergillus mulundensis]|uniref:Uncharacterized protein n=1 Tax=Aspergillus mulundensis TaxID=1810919 RepID=A0A3D8SBV4_9EURO|nr:hypothetical protein DSM5745_04126 [Aspergillus mulundensis]RDW83800.1 hypothetical protein DSM5745_04126 [Aspergillus mulundensis]
MPSYLITGASRGLGFEFLRQLSADPTNLVIGLVRNKAATEEKVAHELKRDNIRIVQGELTDYDSLKNAVEAVEKITPSLDHLIANAAVVSTWSAWDGLGTLAAKDPAGLTADLLSSLNTNLIGNINLITLFLPLIQRSAIKKVIAITTGMADLDFIAHYNIAIGAPYSISKAALNAAIAKFSAEYRKDGILFLGLSPGLVDTSEGKAEMTEEQKAGVASMVAQFATYAPAWKGPITPEESVGLLRGVIERAHVDRGYAGAFLNERLPIAYNNQLDPSPITYRTSIQTLTNPAPKARGSAARDLPAPDCPPTAPQAQEPPSAGHPAACGSTQRCPSTPHTE